MMESQDVINLNQYRSEKPDKGDILRYKMISRYCIGKILDLGCGSGHFREFIKVIPDGNYIGLDTNGNIDIHASVYQIPFQNNTFNTVVMSEVLEHLERPVEALKEATRVSINRIILSVPNPWSINQLLSLIIHNYNIHEKYHINLFGDNEINQIINRSGLNLVEIVRFHIPIPRTSYYIPIKSRFGEYNIYICEKALK